MIINNENIEIRVTSIHADQNEVNWLEGQIAGQFVTLVELKVEIVNEDQMQAQDFFVYIWSLDDFVKYYVTAKSKYEELLHGIPSDIFIEGFTREIISRSSDWLSLSPIDYDDTVIEMYGTLDETKHSLFCNCFDFANCIADTMWTMYGGHDFYPISDDRITNITAIS